MIEELSKRVSKLSTVMECVRMLSCFLSKLSKIYKRSFSYGFCYADNRYDSMIVKVKLNVNISHDLSVLEGSYEELLPHYASREDMACAEEIRFKFDALNLSMILYYSSYF